MKILIVFATNSGNTFMVGHLIQNALEQKGHQVNMRNASYVTTEEIHDHQVLLLGSSSWDWQGDEGRPLRSMIELMENLKSEDLDHKPVAIFGCGDTDFTHFCGAVDHIEEFAKQKNTQILTDPLKVDKFYLDIKAKTPEIESWVDSLATKLKSL